VDFEKIEGPPAAAETDTKRIVQYDGRLSHQSMEYDNLIVLYSSDMLHPSSSTDTLYLPINDTTLNFQR